MNPRTRHPDLTEPRRRRRRDRARRPGARRGYTLIEALVASALLGIVVLAVISAVSASQRMAFEGQKQILAVMAADDLLGELITLPYADLRLRDGLDQPVGAMQTLDGQAYTNAAWALGRVVSVSEETYTEPSMSVSVRGLRVIVVARDEFRPLATLETFVPEPGT